MLRSRLEPKNSKKTGCGALLPSDYGDADELKNFNELSKAKEEQEFVKSTLEEPQTHLAHFIPIIFSFADLRAALNLGQNAATMHLTMTSRC